MDEFHEPIEESFHFMIYDVDWSVYVFQVVEYCDG